MTTLLNIIRNIFAVIGLIIFIIAFSLYIAPQHEWKWSEKNKIESPSKLVSAVIEIGSHPDAIDLVRVGLKDTQGEYQELWSGYSSSKPKVIWTDNNSLLINYKKGETHTFWPSVIFSKQTYNIKLKYK